MISVIKCPRKSFQEGMFRILGFKASITLLTLNVTMCRGLLNFYFFLFFFAFSPRDNFRGQLKVDHDFGPKFY
jgi:hypothetical protein